MIKKFVTAAILVAVGGIAIAALPAYIGSGELNAAPMSEAGLGVLEKAAPNWSWPCDRDRVACLERRSRDLIEIGRKVSGVLATLLDERERLSTRRKSAEHDLATNERLLAEGRDVFQRSLESGWRSVRWKGVRYTPDQLRDQLHLLFDERPILQAAVEQLQKSAGEIEQRVTEIAALRTRVASEGALITSKMALAKAGQLTNELDRVIGTIDKLAANADRALNKSTETIATLRSTVELDAAEKKEEKKQDPPFEEFLRGRAAPNQAR